MSQMLTIIQETSRKIFTKHFFLKKKKTLDNLPKFVRATNVLEKEKYMRNYNWGLNILPGNTLSEQIRANKGYYNQDKGPFKW